jgi:hypothetical protein
MYCLLLIMVRYDDDLVNIKKRDYEKSDVVLFDMYIL